MTLRAYATAAVVLLLIPARSVAAQARSPIQDLLGASRAALNDLRYTEADSIAQAVLDFGQLRRTERIQAYQLMAGARYPEQVSAQQREFALEALRALVRIAPTSVLPREVAWPGLEALFREAKLSTFGISASPRETNQLIGPDQSLEINVVASRPAKFRLLIQPDGGPPLPLDSLTGATQGTLRMKVLSGGAVRFPSGSFALIVAATDEVTRDSIALTFSATTVAPPLVYVTVPDRFDEQTLLIEATKPKRSLGIVGGVLAAAGTIITSRVLRGSDLRASAGGDSRAIGIGLLLGVGTAGGVWLLDKGEPIPANIKANAENRAGFQKRVADAGARNAELLRTYQADITINPEPRP